MKSLLILLTIGSVSSLSACVGMTQMQDTAAKFDQGVHDASIAEANLFNQVRAAECSRNFYTQGYEFAIAKLSQESNLPITAGALDLRASNCVHTELTDAELDIRVKLLQSITLYADAIQTLTNGTSNIKLNEEASELAGNIKQLGEQQKFGSLATEGVAGLNAAIITMTTMIIDHSSYRHVKEAASAMQGPLSTIVSTLKTENVDDAKGLESKADSLLNEMRVGLSAARDKNGAASFLDIVWARITLQSIVVAPPDIAQINVTLDAILKANAALAQSSNGGAIPEISDLITRAQQACRLFNASK